MVIDQHTGIQEQNILTKITISNLLCFKLKYMQDASNSHLKKYSSITAAKLHYIP